MSASPLSLSAFPILTTPISTLVFSGSGKAMLFHEFRCVKQKQDTEFHLTAQLGDVAVIRTRGGISEPAWFWFLGSQGDTNSQIQFAFLFIPSYGMYHTFYPKKERNKRTHCPVFDSYLWSPFLLGDGSWYPTNMHFQKWHTQSELVKYVVSSLDSLVDICNSDRKMSWNIFFFLMKKKLKQILRSLEKFPVLHLWLAAS